MGIMVLAQMVEHLERYANGSGFYPQLERFSRVGSMPTSQVIIQVLHMQNMFMRISNN